MGGGGFQDSQPDTVTGQKISHWHPAEETQRQNKVKVLYYTPIVSYELNASTNQ